MNALHIIWGNEFPEKYNHQDYFLLFDEDSIEFPSSVSHNIFYASAVSREIRVETAQQYISLTAGLSSLKKSGIDLRSALTDDTLDCSIWWFHFVSARYDPLDKIFDYFLAIKIILKVAKHLSVTNLLFYSVPNNVVRAFYFRGNISIITSGPDERRRISSILIFGLLSRFKYLFQSVVRKLFVLKFGKFNKRHFDILIFGFWDWSVKRRANGEIHDLYFKRVSDLLPNKLECSHSWLVLFDPFSQKKAKLKDFKAKILSASGSHQVVFLEHFIGFFEILKNCLTYRHFFIFLKFKKSIKAFLRQEDADYFPLFENELNLRFLDSSLPHLISVAHAVRAASEEIQPKIVASFLETYPISRALFSGVKAGNPEALTVAVQHASRNYSSVFFMHDPDIEVNPNSNINGVPRADKFIAMGELGRKLVQLSGYDNDDVFLCGCPRFDDVILNSKFRKKRTIHNVLYLASGDLQKEVLYFRRALKAISEIGSFSLKLREHFFWKLSDLAEFATQKEKFLISSGTLLEDAEWADLVLFSSSTAADECVLLGVPTWQLSSFRSNASALSFDIQIPKYYSSQELKIALSKSQKIGPSAPELNLRKRIEENTFYRADGKSAERTVNIFGQLLEKTRSY